MKAAPYSYTERLVPMVFCECGTCPRRNVKFLGWDAIMCIVAAPASGIRASAD